MQNAVVQAKIRHDDWLVIVTSSILLVNFFWTEGKVSHIGHDFITVLIAGLFTATIRGGSLRLAVSKDGKCHLLHFRPDSETESISCADLQAAIDKGKKAPFSIGDNVCSTIGIGSMIRFFLSESVLMSSSPKLTLLFMV